LPKKAKEKKTLSYHIHSKSPRRAAPARGLLALPLVHYEGRVLFDVDESGAKAIYEKLRVAYFKIFDSRGSNYRLVAPTPARWRSVKRRVPGLPTAARTGDIVRATPATTRERRGRDGEDAAPFETGPLDAKSEVHTPKHGTIDEVMCGLGVTKDKMFNSVLYLLGTARLRLRRSVVEKERRGHGDRARRLTT